ncbi:hypothetical protein KNO15_07435 [Leifsonia shinshuensis]|uniref:hypothetical protein n=1 Tax=Leifsonia shinshuensis TaxID=150026 RepID=UPI001F5079AB|nr:hypothetical protein [Leifsonia shinshuensis]MCI0156527.1 hypothetical protein [Leifsonia shinshuensis]
MDKETARHQTRATTIVGRVLMVLALVSGIAAMHMGIDMPMTAASTAASAQADPMSMHSSMAAPTTHRSPDAAHAGLTSTPALAGPMSHDAMHACLFLLAAALLLLLASPLGNKLPFSAPRLIVRWRQDAAVRARDRTLVLQVLRI